MTGNDTQTNHWWGTSVLDVGESLERVIGPLRLVVERSAREWRIATPGPDADDAGARADAAGAVERYVVGDVGGALRVSPLVADRQVVTEPVTPIHVAPGGRITLYVSTPLWYVIEVGEPPVRLRDAYIVRASDTWFGPSTREGELCYASRTAGRLELADLPLRAERAVTAVTISNETGVVLPLQRISLPAPNLALYADTDGMLWTQDLLFDNREEAELADVILADEPPADVPSATRVSEPRVRTRGRRLFKAFGAMFR